jgi:hypothetical protein
MRQTHTYVILRISSPAFYEIKAMLEEAGYQHAFHHDPDVDAQGGDDPAPSEPVIDMRGIAVGVDHAR